MKTLRFIGMALIAVIMCVNFVACSDDDDEETNATIEGTWKYTSSFDEDMRSGSFTFKSNGGLIWYHGEESSSNCSYTLNGSNLKIILNQDDYIEGTIAISKNQATYKYTWHDYDGKWDDDYEFTMTLVKQ
ncbi:hypothetical protein [Bacteroides muris (ex Afrizal et al. 2022)]|jgi:uncharacterized lipoprotein YehR (DUF1307 family)|uniref:Lipocalin-like domain-containing protein n=2 Tax=Bacteroides TaxID=816 RepID=A0A4S2AD53_9BACE|nr:hypothetical protein [Bacteroides muris (ex Afrizal et al. 2022)]TGX98520.1 hypothetical protein E5355_18300 [Bacteroides muris (ex Afrizal et al. 2022)]